MIFWWFPSQTLLSLYYFPLFFFILYLYKEKEIIIKKEKTSKEKENDKRHKNMYYIIAVDTIWSTSEITSFIVWERKTRDEAERQLEIVQNRSDTSCCHICNEKPVPKGNDQMSYYDEHNKLIETIGEPDLENSGKNLSRLVFGKYYR